MRADPSSAIRFGGTRRRPSDPVPLCVRARRVIPRERRIVQTEITRRRGVEAPLAPRRAPWRADGDRSDDPRNTCGLPSPPIPACLGWTYRLERASMRGDEARSTLPPAPLWLKHWAVPLAGHHHAVRSKTDGHLTCKNGSSTPTPAVITMEGKGWCAQMGPSSVGPRDIRLSVPCRSAGTAMPKNA